MFHHQEQNNLEQLREAIVTECHNAMIQNTFDTMVTQARRCIDAAGYAFQDE